jgi:hypothetical protein
MTIVAVIGDCATTTCVALASQWPTVGAAGGARRGCTADEVIVVEADASGGSLAGWLDTPASPSLTTVVATVGNDGLIPSMTAIESLVHHSASGVRFVAAPVRSSAAARAVADAAMVVLPALAGSDLTAIVDVGRHLPSQPMPPAVALASVIVAVHRQHSASAGAEAVRLERLVELIEQLASTAAPLVLAVVGEQPFEPSEIGGFVESSVPGAVERILTIADDPLSAAAIAGRRGVSAKRMNRLPLFRSIGDAGTGLHALAGRDRAGRVEVT